MMAFYGQLAEEATPSRELIKVSLEDAAYKFTAVSARDVSAILDTVLGGKFITHPKCLCPNEDGGPCRAGTIVTYIRKKKIK